MTLPPPGGLARVVAHLRSRWPGYLATLLIGSLGLALVARVSEAWDEDYESRLLTVPIPGSITLDLPSTGRYTVFAEWAPDAPIPTPSRPRSDTLQGTTVVVEEIMTGQLIPLSEPFGASEYGRPDYRVGMNVLEFQLAQGGSYRFTTQSPPEARRGPTDLVVMHEALLWTVPRILAKTLSLLGVIGLSLCIATSTFLGILRVGGWSSAGRSAA
jgi:hypothetical protein